MPNAFAYLALFSWPLVAAVLFRLMPPLRAMIWTILGGYLFLPVGTGVNFPMLPTLDKSLVPSLSAAVLVWSALRREKAAARLRALREARRNRSGPAGTGTVPAAAAARIPAEAAEAAARGPLWWLSSFALLMILVLPFAVYRTNREPVIYATRALEGLGLYDAFSMALSGAMAVLPFLLGRRYLRGPGAQRELLAALAWGGLLYSPLILVELRMSPQLNVWVYGFFPHSFIQHVRDGGYRPVVFLEHGLRVGIYLAMACLAAAVLSRDGRRATWLAVALGLGLMLLLSKNLGATAIALVIAPVAAFAGRRLQILAAAVLAAVVLVYPMLRGAGLVPTDTVAAWAESVSPERAASLEVRLRNEDRLLERANEKPLFGWGGWGRSRVYNEAGQDISTTDGIWAIIMGTGGWLGYLAHFGLLTGPLLAALLRRRPRPGPEGPLPGLILGSGLGLVLAANLADMLPNSSLTPLSWLIAGTLTGALLRAPRTAPVARHPAAAAGPGRRTGTVQVRRTGSRDGSRAPAGAPPDPAGRGRPG